MSQLTIEDKRLLAERARAGEIVGSGLAAALATHSDLAGIDLSRASLEGADLAGLNLFKARLSFASLRGADLSGCELTGANLQGADLEEARLAGAGLGMANLREANAFRADLTEATLTGANLGGTNLSCAVLARSRIREADLSEADFRAADLREAELSKSHVQGAHFDDADMRGARLRAIIGYRSASWYGVDIRDINFAGAYGLRRHVMDENYLREFRESGRLQAVLYQIWWWTSDCGRSVGRWLLNIVAVALVFAALFWAVGVNVGPYESNALTHLYYSVVTLTGLGYGDIVPASGAGQVLAMIEVGIGYMMLGGLISIFATKMARRAE